MRVPARPPPAQAHTLAALGFVLAGLLGGYVAARVWVRRSFSRPCRVRAGVLAPCIPLPRPPATPFRPSLPRRTPWRSSTHSLTAGGAASACCGEAAARGGGGGTRVSSTPWPTTRLQLLPPPHACRSAVQALQRERPDVKVSAPWGGSQARRCAALLHGGGLTLCCSWAHTPHAPTPPTALQIVIYCRVGSTPQQLAAESARRFGLAVAPTFRLVPLRSAELLLPERYPRLTMLRQAWGSVRVAAEGLRQLVPELYVDTTGWAFPYPLARLAGARVAAYVHYPTISTDMLQRCEQPCAPRVACMLRCACGSGGAGRTARQAGMGCSGRVHPARPRAPHPPPRPTPPFARCAQRARPRAHVQQQPRASRQRGQVGCQASLLPSLCADLRRCGVVRQRELRGGEGGGGRGLGQGKGGREGAASARCTERRRRPHTHAHHARSLLPATQVVMVNSSWTRRHIRDLWWQWREPARVYPPCDTAALQALPLDRRLKRVCVVSVAQFRPEKDHALQLRAFARARQLAQRTHDAGGDAMLAARLQLVGGCRGEPDRLRLEELKGGWMGGWRAWAGGACCRGWAACACCPLPSARCPCTPPSSPLLTPPRSAGCPAGSVRVGRVPRGCVRGGAARAAGRGGGGPAHHGRRALWHLCG